MLTIIVSDSRGRYLDTLIDDENILVSFHSGANLSRVAIEAVNIIRRFNPNTIVLMAGINDITRLNRRTRKISLFSSSRSVIIHHLISCINQAKYYIHSHFPNVNNIIGRIIGVSINTYNRVRGISPVQWVVDDVITAVNSYIRQLNTDSGLPHPRHGLRKHIYSRLRDGLHPGNLTLESWAYQLCVLHHRLQMHTYV